MSTFLQQLTYGGVLFAVLAQQLGLPVPSVVFLMAAGTVSAYGRMSPAIIISLAVLACLIGDGAWFFIGRRWGSKAMRLLCRFTADPRNCSRNAQDKFRRYGLPVLCAAKFLPGLDAVMPPLSGAEGVPLRVFLVLDALGSFLWAAAYFGLGYVFSKELEVIVHWIQRFGTVIGIAIVVPVALYAGSRAFVVAKMIRHLRFRRISPPMLARKLRSDTKVAVLDLAQFDEETGYETLETIPGAFVVDPSLLHKSPQIAVPDDIKVILYSSSGSSTVSARAAVGLRRIGIHKVWVLEGGLKAWREHGFPVSQSPEIPEVVAARYGIKLPAAANNSN